MQDNSLDFLILGAGWTSTFLIPLLRARNHTFAATTRDGRQVADSNTIEWTFDPDDEAKNQYSVLPLAATILISFPLKGPGQSRTLVSGYSAVHDKSPSKLRFIQLGSTGIWQNPDQASAPWMTRHSAFNPDARSIAEDELISLEDGKCGTVLNLAGLWGGSRDPRHWVDRVGKTKDEVKAKRSVHLVHGIDVARAILAVAAEWKAARGQRWMITDGFVYDWWALFAGWADLAAGGDNERDDGDGVDRKPRKQAGWVFELMREEGIKALPRSMEVLGRCYDVREFWETFKLTPLRARA